MVAQDCDLSFGRERQEEGGFKAVLGYTASSKPAPNETAPQKRKEWEYSIACMALGLLCGNTHGHAQVCK